MHPMHDRHLHRYLLSDSVHQLQPWLVRVDDRRLQVHSVQPRQLFGRLRIVKLHAVFAWFVLDGGR